MGLSNQRALQNLTTISISVDSALEDLDSALEDLDSIPLRDLLFKPDRFTKYEKMVKIVPIFKTLYVNH